MWTAPADGSSNDLCDWLELSALLAPARAAFVADVNAELEIEADTEDSNFEEQNAFRERRLAMVGEALRERRDHMADAYPFDIDEGYARISLRPAPSAGGKAYLFCLLVSHAGPGGQLDGEPALKAGLGAARRLFQICATVAMAGYCRGPAYSFGWPRLDGSTFLAKLQQVFRHLADGRPHTEYRNWQPRDAKDDGIDVIAWKKTPDNSPLGYALGQAASGANWKEKSVKHLIETFHATWFTQRPACSPTPLLVMPHLLHANSSSILDHQTQQELNDATWRSRLDHGGLLSQQELNDATWRSRLDHGGLLYRHLVAHYVDEATRLDGVQPIEDLDRIDELAQHVADWTEALRATFGEE